MKTIDKRRRLALGLAIGLVLGFVLVVFLTSPEFLRQLSPSGHEMFFNFLFLAVALVLSFFFLVFYPTFHSKCRGPFKDFYPLIGAIVLIIWASGLIGLYDDLHKIYSDAYGLTPEEEAVKTRLTENLNILRLVVPAVMLAVAANLITTFLHPLETNSDKFPPP